MFDWFQVQTVVRPQLCDLTVFRLSRHSQSFFLADQVTSCFHTLFPHLSLLTGSFGKCVWKEKAPALRSVYAHQCRLNETVSL